MGCTRACDEAHTHGPGCAMQISRASEPTSTPTPTHLLSSRCANSLCVNQPHEGRFVLLAIPAGKRSVALFMCAPCAEEIAVRL